LVECATCREALSARLDGEDHPDERAAVDGHLAWCAPCRDWSDEAAAVGRLLHAASVVPPSPGIPADVLLAAPGRWRARLGVTLRWLLGALGVAQFLLGATQIAALAGRTHVHEDQVASAGHLWHESAAWNLAIGAGFVFISARRSRPSGITPVLTVFVVTLTLLSVGDVAAGRVQASWLLSHLFILTGYVIVVLLGRPSFQFGDPPGDRAGRRWSLHAEVDEEPGGVPTLTAGRRNVPGAPAAHRRHVA
jgi:predicted anti-sigma-YlaC factor YlaD